MISLQKRFLFVHIPKTAGNSIQTILRPYSEDEIVAVRAEQDGIERFGLRNPKYKIKKHSTLAEYRAALGEARFPDLYKFTCVRNPWDRMVSYYFGTTQLVETWDQKEFRKLIFRALSVTDFLQLDRREADPFGNMDHIMRFENLADDFRAVSVRLVSPMLHCRNIIVRTANIIRNTMTLSFANESGSALLQRSNVLVMRSKSDRNPIIFPLLDVGHSDDGTILAAQSRSRGCSRNNFA